MPYHTYVYGHPWWKEYYDYKYFHSINYDVVTTLYAKSYLLAATLAVTRCSVTCQAKPPERSSKSQYVYKLYQKPIKENS